MKCRALRHQSSVHTNQIFVILSVADFIIRAALQPRVRYQKSDRSIVFIIFFKNLTTLFRNFSTKESRRHLSSN
jgi:hypothetical protein